MNTDVIWFYVICKVMYYTVLYNYKKKILFQLVKAKLHRFDRLGL